MSASPSRPTPVISLVSAPAHPARGHAAGAETESTFAYLLARWHLLSLDAPTVAVVWTVFIARCAGTVLPGSEAAAMFLAVWILYAADRLLDARSLASHASSAGLEERHRYHDRHRSAFSASIVIALPLLVLLLCRSNQTALRLDVLLGTLLLAWLLLIHARPGAWSRLPKEFAVGLFFPAAIFVPTVARAPALRPALLPEALLFAAVCSLNCLYIFAWEHTHSFHAHWSTRWAVARLSRLTAATIAACGIVAAMTCLSSHPLLALPAMACATSAALLLLLHARNWALAPVTLRAAADLCLLTPVLFLLILASS